VAETTDLAATDDLLGRELTEAEIKHLIGEMDLKALAMAANCADETEFHQLARPALVELLRRTEGDPRALVSTGYGDLSRLAAAILISTRFKNAPLHQKSAQAQHKVHREDLEGPNPTPIESMLAARVALDWLQLHLHEVAYSGVDGDTSMRDREHIGAGPGQAPPALLARPQDAGLGPPAEPAGGDVHRRRRAAGPPARPSSQAGIPQGPAGTESRRRPVSLRAGRGSATGREANRRWRCMRSHMVNPALGLMSTLGQ
jgi:hypothetical protein